MIRGRVERLINEACISAEARVMLLEREEESEGRSKR
jgi:hypothetical protein